MTKRDKNQKSKGQNFLNQETVSGMVTKRDRDKRFFLSSVCFKQRELNKGEQRIRINYSWDHPVVKRQSIKVDWNLIVFVERFI